MFTIAAASGGPVPPSLAIAGAVVALLIGLITLASYAGKAGRKLLQWGRKLGHVADEVLGDGDKRPGWGQRIGVLEEKLTAAGETDAAQTEKLDQLTARLGSVEELVRRVDHEVRPNGGSSMADTVNRIASAAGVEPGPRNP